MSLILYVHSVILGCDSDAKSFLTHMGLDARVAGVGIFGPDRLFEQDANKADASFGIYGNL